MGKQKSEQANPSKKETGESSAARGPAIETSGARSGTRDGASTNDAETKQTSRWYGGSWRGKSTAVSGVARETYPPSTDSPATPPSTSITTQRRSSKDLLMPKKSPPIAASMTKLNISSNAATGGDTDPPEQPQPTQDKQPPPPEPTEQQAGEDRLVDARPAPASGWRGWWTRPQPAEESSAAQNSHESSSQQSSQQENQVKPSVNEDSAEDQTMGGVPVEPSSLKPRVNRSSWFGLWGSTQAEEPSSTHARTKSLPAEPEISQQETADVRPAASIDEPVPTGPKPDRPASGSWAFWSRERPRPSTPDAQGGATGSTETGELAVENTPSSTDPQPANVTHEVNKKSDRKRGRPISDTVKITAKRKATVGKAEPNPDDSPQPDLYRSSDTSDMAQSILRTTIEKPKPKNEDNEKRHNLVIPELRDVYHVAESPSYWQQLTRILGRGNPTQNHVSISPHILKPKKALAVGVHGFFPAALIQRVIGPPTGTSLRFASEAASAIERWCYSHSIECEIEKVALEGEGTIFSRVEALWKLLLNWIDALRTADLIIFAAHSQGVPVTVMLVSKLINFGCLKSDARIGICAMAGVNTGPFASYQTRLLGAAANELFSFSRVDSEVSRRYIEALNHCLSFHVRVLYIGSIDDQLVPIDSSTFVPLTHGYIFRAVFVDGRLHAPDFLTRLVGFVLKLRNLGISDHGLLRELSSPLAGSLYTGEGHSRIYEDDAVYDLALEVTLETTTLPNPPTLDTNTLRQTRDRTDDQSSTAVNPYFLPWAMRGVLEEDYVRTALRDETAELLNLFEGWKPTSKVLKDVKFRLEAVKSKL